MLNKETQKDISPTKHRKERSISARGDERERERERGGVCDGGGGYRRESILNQNAYTQKTF